MLSQEPVLHVCGQEQVDLLSPGNAGSGPNKADTSGSTSCVRSSFGPQCLSGAKAGVAVRA